jgi:pimeloyl-ACP methyl ester carboxylesterase
MARSSAVSAAFQRASLRALSLVTPSRVERLIVDRFATPSRDRAEAGAPIAEPWFLRSGDEALAVYTAGRGQRVLFVHGWEGTASDLRPIIDRVHGAGFGIATFDQPAHGRSAGSRATLRQFANAVLDVARATGPFSAVVAHSLGASAVMLALGEELFARRAVLIAPPYDARHFIRQTASRLGLPAARAAGAIELLERQGIALGGRDADRVAAQITIPALVLHDRGDRYVPFAHGEAIVAAWPGSRLVPLEGLGHRRALQDAAVHEHILRFVQETV